ncbi:MAG TPA: LPD7 domain-containing protein [Paraburkholderia sp.]|uniref:LPD7 domain-containing protein n=1 Tax=Paraburkholderia sp. TaxID=1926495 RepID=UPI002C877F3D|nr:LPD7 domain-containing protein [Paraburkholderia sp.]HTR09051.1 LPD7 domain-containing protein [Paraburkholderia sp.]
MNEIEFPADQIDHRERGAANADDASVIRARTTPPANEPEGEAVPRHAELPVDSATQARLKKIRAADRERARQRLAPDALHDAQTAEGVKTAKGTGRLIGRKDGETQNSIRPRPIFEKTGYDVPKSVSDQYVAHDGKFLDRKSETVHFEDTGRTLATASEDRSVIAHMVEVAKAKNWSELQLRGTDEFCRQAWIAAELAGIPTRGFKPKEVDRAMLTAAREAMRIGAGKQAGDAHEARTNTLETAAAPKAELARPEKPMRRAAASAADPIADAPPGERSPQPDRAGPGTEAPPPPPTLEQPAAGVTAGVLVAHGPAPFNHDARQNPSYYATVRTVTGERTVWGLDLERAISGAGVQVGQHIELEKGGSRTVTSRQRQFDAQGNERAPKTVTSRRNEWRVSSPDMPGLPTHEQREALATARREVDERRRIHDARERFLNGNWQYSKEQRAALDAARERIKEQAAREVLREEIKGLPEHQQEKLMGEFESAVAAARAENRPLDVPMPQVSEATIEAVREQIEREQRGLPPSVQQPAQETTGHPSQEAGREAPPFELEP